MNFFFVEINIEIGDRNGDKKSPTYGLTSPFFLFFHFNPFNVFKQVLGKKKKNKNNFNNNNNNNNNLYEK